MDGDRFDRAVRLFGVATTRRGALTTIAGIGGLLGVGGAGASHRKHHHKKTCKKGHDAVWQAVLHGGSGLFPSQMSVSTLRLHAPGQ